MAAHFPASGCAVPIPGAWFSNDRIVHRPNGSQRAHYDRCGASIRRRDASHSADRLSHPATSANLPSGFASDSKTLWQTDSLWQPLREVIEKLLIAYDWAESFVGLNLVLKPLVDELFMKYLSDVALREDDYLLGQIFYSLNEDCQWHRQWSESLVRMAIEDNVRNRDTIQGWINRWYPLAARAVHRFASLLEGTLQQNERPPLQPIGEAIDCYYLDYLRPMSLEVGS